MYSAAVTSGAASAVEDVIVVQSSSHHSSSPATSLSEVDDESSPLSPDSDYSKAAENVAEDKSESYLHCGNHVTPFTAVHFDTPPADLVPHRDNERPTTSQDVDEHGSDRSVGSGRNSDEVASGLPAKKNDRYCCAAGQDLSHNASSHLAHSRTTGTADVAVSTDSSDDGKDVAEGSSYSPQHSTARSVAGHDSESSSTESPSPRDWLDTLHGAKDSASSDTDYARVSLTQRPFPAELYGKAAPLPPDQP